MPAHTEFITTSNIYVRGVNHCPHQYIAHIDSHFVVRSYTKVHTISVPAKVPERYTKTRLFLYLHYLTVVRFFRWLWTFLGMNLYIYRLRRAPDLNWPPLFKRIYLRFLAAFEQFFFSNTITRHRFKCLKQTQELLCTERGKAVQSLSEMLGEIREERRMLQEGFKPDDLYLLRAIRMMQ